MRYDAYIPRVPWQIIFHQSVSEWLSTLPRKERDSFMRAVEMLKEFGPTLGRPLVGSIKSSSFKNMKELRPLSTNMRCLFAFDHMRRAILLVAGDKSFRWRGWYQSAIPLADDRFRAYLKRESM